MHVIRRRVARYRARRRTHSPAATWGLRLACVIALAWSLAIPFGFTRALSVLTFLGFIAAIAGVRFPELGLFGIGLLVVIDPVVRHLLLGSGGLLRWNSFNYWLLLTMVLFAPRLWRLSDPHSKLLTLLIAVIAFDLLMSRDLEAGMQTLFNAITVFALVLAFLRTPRDEDTLFWLGATMGLAAAIGGAAFYREPDLLSSMNKNAFAMFPLAGVFGACIAFPYATRMRLAQPMLAAVAAIDVTWVFLSRSRSALILALIGMAFLVTTARTVTMRLIYIGAAALVAMIIAAQFGALETTATARFDKLFNADVSLEERTSGRANLMRGGWQIFLKNPFGIGTGSFEDAWSQLEQPETTSQWAAGKQVPPHSAWLMVLVENGVPGILLFIAYVLSFAVAGLRHRDRRLLLMGLFVTSMLAVAFTMNEFQGKALWFAAAAATALLQPLRADTMVAMRRRRSRMVHARPLVTPVPADV
jgi:O-antigen ligase